MNQDKTNQCPCGSDQSYELCCQPLHKGMIPKNALQLMRSRFSAYALNLPDYIISTTHPASPQYIENRLKWKNEISEFSKENQFEKLEILDFKEKETLATVVFTAHLLRANENTTFTEKSYFEKVKNRWYYRGGQLKDGHVPSLVTRGELRLMPLAYYDDTILRRKADPIQEINDEIKILAEQMIETMDASDGIGLAAPQIHHSIRMFVMRMPIEKEDGYFQAGDVIVVVNPVLSNPSQEKCKLPEGCLSIPTIRSVVERPKEITMTYSTLDGTTETKRLQGWAARVAMHENDHLNGVLFIDRLSKEEKEKLKPILQNLNLRIHDGLAL